MNAILAASLPQVAQIVGDLAVAVDRTAFLWLRSIYDVRGDSVYVDNGVYIGVYPAAAPGLRDALDLAYLEGQRPADTR